MTDTHLTDDLVSAPLSARDARAKCEEAANIIIARYGGSWEWLNGTHLRVWTVDGAPFMTLKIEAIQ